MNASPERRLYPLFFFCQVRGNETGVLFFFKRFLEKRVGSSSDVKFE